MSHFEPSVYQQGIFNWITDPSPARRHGVVNAVAGSGKTTTLVQAASLVRGDALFVAFNKHIVEELGARLTGTAMIAKTMHSVGMNALAKELPGIRLQVKDRKYSDMARDELKPRYREWAELRPILNFVTKMVDMTRVNLVDPADREAVLALADHYSVDLPERDEDVAVALGLIPDLIARGDRMASRSGIIDFTDMIYLPAKWGVKPPQFAWVFVDECQDLNAAQFALAQSCIAPGGRSLFVGDPHQAIYGFAGADAESFHRIRRTLDAENLPLSICYRCPTSHVALAQGYVPDIQARPGAPEGIIGKVAEGELYAQVRAGDYILCRLTAPLIGACIDLIKHRVPAYVRGRDIGKKLTDIIDAAVKGAGPTYRWESFGEHLTRYYDFQHLKLLGRDNADSAIQTLTDQVDAVRVCYEQFAATDDKDLARQIDDLFHDLTNAVTLCTVHRAKGLEGDRVFILREDKLPLTWAKQQAWETEQELNLCYVAFTRAKQELYFIDAQAAANTTETPPASPVKNHIEAAENTLELGSKPLDLSPVTPHTVKVDDDVADRPSAMAEYIASATPRRTRKAPAAPKSATTGKRKSRNP